MFHEGPALDEVLHLSDLEEEGTSHNVSHQSAQSESEDELQSVSSLPLEKSVCSAVCCTDFSKVYQPTSKKAIESLFNQRKFRPEWFKKYPWLTACITKKKVFCLPCRYIFKNKLLTFSRNSNPAFIEDGFNTWRKATKRFHDHEGSLSHHNEIDCNRAT